MRSKHNKFNLKVFSILLLTSFTTLFMGGLEPTLVRITQARTHKVGIYSNQVSIQDFDLDFSTYLGGSDFEHARDVFVDGQGYIYVTGGTKSTDFPTTTGPKFNNGSCSTLGSQGRMDAFVAKFGASGNLIWSRLLGGPCYERGYGIEVDSQGYVVVAGRAGEGFPVTSGAFQTTFQGIDNGVYGMQNAFVAKISPDGSAVEWASYVGVGRGARDIALDDQDNIYLPLEYSGQGSAPPSEWFTNAFQPDLQGGIDCGAIKINSSGTQVIWATWLGGSGDDYGSASIRVDGNNYVYLGLSTDSDDIPTTSGAHDRSFNGGVDFYLARLSPDGSNLIYGTYLGGSGNEWINTHNIALEPSGNLFASIWTNSTDFPTTPGAIQTNYGGGSSDVGLAKLSPSGGLLVSTYLGGTGGDNADGMYADHNGYLYLSGVSDSSNFPISTNAFQPNKSGGEDAVFAVMSPNLDQLSYATFMGGSSNDNGRSSALGLDGSMVIIGQSDGSGWPTLNPYQSNYGGGQMDAILAKYSLSGIDPTPPPPVDLPYKVFLPLSILEK